MKIGQSLLVTIAVVAVPIASAGALSNQYLCLVEASSGLHFDIPKGAWTPKVFGSAKYIVRRLNDDDWIGKYKYLLEGSPKPNWAVYKFGVSALHKSGLLIEISSETSFLSAIRTCPDSIGRGVFAVAILPTTCLFLSKSLTLTCVFFVLMS